VVAVGRIGSPDMMASMVRKGIVDFIGAARPSISDPFLPKKIEEGRIEEIRECIGCNICVSADSLSVPIRCTQNPTMGEEWRRGWHPEKIAPKGSEEAALVVGAGPAGLECAMQLARRGYDVTLAEAGPEMGGRVLAESGLPGLGAWKRVADHRLYDLSQRGNVQMFTGSALGAEEVLELGIPNVFIATGSHWRADGRGRNTLGGLETDGSLRVLTPDDIMAGKRPPAGPVMIYDDDQAYLAGVIAELLAASHPVVFVTPANMVSPFTELTLEQHRIQRRLIELDVEIITHHSLAALKATPQIACSYTGRLRDIACASVVLVTERVRETALYDSLRAQDHGLRTLSLIGDAANPGMIADAVYEGHRAARNFERDPAEVDAEFFRREMTALSD